MKIFLLLLLTKVSFLSHATDVRATTIKCLEELRVGDSIADTQYKVVKHHSGKFILWNDKGSLCEFNVSGEPKAIVVSTPSEKIYFTYYDESKNPPFKKQKLWPAVPENEYVSGNATCGTSLNPKLEELLDFGIPEIPDFSSTYSLWTNRVWKKAEDSEDAADRFKRIEAWRLERIAILKRCQNIGSEKFKTAVSAGLLQLQKNQETKDGKPTPAAVK